MYLDWKPGDRLVCVDATPPPLAALLLFRSWICSGQVYTLRQLVIPAPGGPNPGPGVYLAEIRNPIEPESGFEYGYLAYRFEKLEQGTVALPARGGLQRGEPSKTALQRIWRPQVPLRPSERGLRPLRASGGLFPKGSVMLAEAKITTKDVLDRIDSIAYTFRYDSRSVCFLRGRNENPKHP